MFVFSKFDVDRWVTLAGYTEMCLRVKIFVIAKTGVHMLKVEVLRKIGHDHLHSCFSKWLPEANPPSSAKWDKSVCVPLFSRRCQWQGVSVLKPLRQEFLWSLPLICIVLDCLEVDYHFIVSSDIVVAKFWVTCKPNWHSTIAWILHAQRL